MHWFSKLKLKTKILAGFMTVVLIASVMGALGFNNIRQMSGLLNDMYSDKLVPIVEINEANIQVIFHNRGLYRLVSEFDNVVMDKVKAEMGKNEASVKQNLETIRKLNLTDKEKELLKRFDTAWGKYLAAAQKVIPLSYEGKNTEAIQLLTGETQSAFDEADKALGELVTMQEAHAKQGFESSNGIVRTMSLVMLFCILGAVAAGIFLAIFIAGLISKPIRELASQAERIADGDLTTSIIHESRDEVGQLADAFARMTANLKETIAKLVESSSTLATASSQLTANTDSLVTGAEEVATQANTVATASEEMSSTSTDIARNCTSAAEGAQHAQELAEAGAGVVQETISLMNRIAERVHTTATTVEMLGNRSDQIGEIIGTIEDIADQTNLLALNAAIEAARAGEQGRGFAVVADEVRALAERTTKATKEIAQMIRAIQNETREAVAAMEQGVGDVEKGKQGASRSGESLHGIVDQINSVSMQVSQIATAAEEQTATTSEITSNIHQISMVIQQSTRGAHDSANAAHQLMSLADEFQGIVRRFKTS
ncbi:MAG: methyl-accepting chemotaxis protein [Desulfuromonadales bacterium]|nr:MAG: methyl-accepting chemotaxis protein [Desulfuromonadales bacterium]